MARTTASSRACPRRIALVSNTSWYLHNFRAPTIRKLLEEGWEVTVVAPDAEYRDELEALGAHFAAWPFSRTSMSPIHNAGALLRLLGLYVTARPDVVHHFTIKPVILGGAAARLAGVKGVVNSVTGLGLAFSCEGLRRKLASLGYRYALGGRALTIFQNEDDLRQFATSGLVSADSSYLIRGSGVDVERLAKTPPSDGNGTVTFLMACRMLWAKGVREFVEAADLVADEHPECRFLLVGSPDNGTPDAVPLDWLASINTRANISWSAFRPDVTPFLERSDVVVLPSYREGLPKTLLEGAAAGRPLVATNVPGCRDVAIDGYTGLLVPKGDSRALADAMLRMSSEPDTRRKLGESARDHVEAWFSERRVVRDTIAVYESTLQPRPGKGERRVRRRTASRARALRYVRSRWLPGSLTGGLRSSTRSPLAESGALVCSLDLELKWGVRDRASADGRYRQNLLGARKAVARILETFCAFHLSATWAAVGCLFASSQRELLEHYPHLRPTYRNRALDPYGEPLGCDVGDDPLHFGGDLIDLIRSTPRQEIASHSFSHYYTLEPGQTAEQFEDDIRSAVRIAAAKGLTLRSIVLPRNQVNLSYRGVLARQGFDCYRGNHMDTSDGAHTHGARSIARGARFADSHANLTGHHTTRWQELRDDAGLCNIPASFFVRPTSFEPGPLTKLQELRLTRAIRHAASEGELLHLWWHPHNFGVHLDENIRMLENVLKTYSECRVECGMRSMTMGDVARRALRTSAETDEPCRPDARYSSAGTEPQLASSTTPSRTA